MKSACIKRIVTLGVSIWIACSPWIPCFAVAQQSQTLHITSVKEFQVFAQNCTEEAYSQGLKVVLDCDLDLSGYDSISVPVFCGIFDGAHHTIRGYQDHGKGSDRGLFRYIQSNAIIQSLTVEGTMEPGGTKSGLGMIAGRNKGMIRSCAVQGRIIGDESVGGIVGVNEASGVVLDCVNQAVVSASTNAGGIVGRSEGRIVNCVNQGMVNTEGEQAATNTGGIAGKSTGIIEHCTNSAEIGYQHIGYNTGGIVGSQNGITIRCANNAAIYGRKDVGGIVGQFEPDINFTYGAAPMDVLDTALDGLSDLMGQMVDQVSQAAGDSIDDFGIMNEAMDSIRQTAHEAGTEAITDAETMIDDVYQAAQSIHLRLDGVIGDTDGFIQQTNYNMEQVNQQMQMVRQSIMDVLYTLIDGIDQVNDEMDRGLEEIDKQTNKALDELQGAKDDLRRLNQFAQRITDILLGGETAEQKLTQLLNALDDLGVIDPVGRVNRAKTALFQASEALRRMASDIRWQIQQSNEDIQQAFNDTDEGLQILENLASTINSDTTAYANSMLAALHQINGYMSTIEDILHGYSKTVGDKGQKTMDDVNHQLTIINDEIGQLTNDAASVNTELHQTAKAIVTQLEQVEEAMKNLVKVPQKTIDDISDIVNVSDKGCVASCTNRAKIEADANVGGIVGMMAPELEIDPEQDIELNHDRITVDTHTLLKATIYSCRNDGDITAKNECAGGILGRSEVGAVLDCASRGQIQIESGGLAGGIAGQSGGVIRTSAALVDLKGTDSLGGIAGQGTDIINCRAMTRIDSNGEKLGAVAGMASGTVSGNYFLKEGLGGVDGITYVGQTQGVDFQTFSNLSGIPVDFLKFSVTFVSNDGVVAQIPVSYGGTLTSEQIPAVPQANHMFGEWSDFTHKNMIRSQTVHAVYDDLLTTVASSGNHPAVLAEGTFSPDASIDVNTWNPQATQIPIGYKLVTAYEYHMKDQMDLPDTVTLHMLAKEEGTTVAVVQNETVQIVQSTKDGSYLIYDGLPEGKVMILYRDHTVKWVICAVLAAILISFIGYDWKKRHKARKEYQACCEQPQAAVETKEEQITSK